MKTTSLQIREDLLEQARQLSGEGGGSRATERALEEFARRSKARKILALAHSGLWKGDLAEMRPDSEPRAHDPPIC